MKILVTGASGLLGKELLVQLQLHGHDVFAVVRNKASLTEVPSENIYEWKSVEDVFPVKALMGMDVVIHLAGSPVSQRWTDEGKHEIYQSRVQGTKQLVAALREIPLSFRPKTLLFGSAIGIHGTGFLSEVTRDWEREGKICESLDMRVVFLRTGVVLSRQGGALSKMAPVILGNGEQWMSWIHIQDWMDFVLEAVRDDRIRGNYDLVAPHAVTNADFASKLAKIVFHTPVIRVPAFVLKFLLGEMSEIVLTGQKVYPGRILEGGFKFKFNDIESALKDLFKGGTFLENEFQVHQFVPSSIEEVFPFFSAAENLEKITPPWLHFKIVDQSSAEVGENSIINYRLKIHGIPARWQTKILDWKIGEKFVDTQTKGPYTKWHHTHTFKKVNGGVLLGDHVAYRVPGHFLGKALLGGFIQKDVSTIFSYRRKIIESLFGKK